MNAANLFTQYHIGNFWFRYLHVLTGIAWIGLLYYFNLVQVPGLAAYGDEGKARNITITQIASRALWWFRWAAVATLGSGLLLAGVPSSYMKNFLNHTDAADLGLNGGNAAIALGMVLGTTMSANVWMIIWKNQKVVLANAANVLNGGEADPNAAGAGRRALLASRQNMIFSVSMLFMMVGAAHLFEQVTSPTAGRASTYVIVTVVIAALFQLNALGKFGGTAAGNKMLKPYESHKNAIITAFILLAVNLILAIVLLG
ncbi:MAG: urate hydroxylase PuuD [Actinomycetota bacterium]